MCAATTLTGILDFRMSQSPHFGHCIVAGDRLSAAGYRQTRGLSPGLPNTNGVMSATPALTELRRYQVPLR